jgi:hypothetical protein
MSLTINDVVYMKIACHAAKHSYKDVYGFLVEDGNGLRDAIPLSHLAINSCFLHSALDLVARTLSKTPELKLCGFYDFEESTPNDKPSLNLQKTILSVILNLSKLQKVYYIRISTVRVSQPVQNLNELTVAEALAEFDKTDYRLNFAFFFFDTTLKDLPESEIKGRFSLQKFESLFSKGEHLFVMDIDEHFDDPSNDFMNPSFSA